MAPEKTEKNKTGRSGLTARDVLHSTFKRLRLFIGIPLVIIILIVVGSLLITPVYEASTDIKIEDTNYTNVGLITTRYDSRNDIFLRKEQQINSEINIARSETVLEAVVRRLELWERWTASGASEADRITSAVNILRNGIDVEPSLDSWVITIRYRNHDPQLASDVVNTMAEEYINHNISMHTLPQAAQFYEETIESEREELRQLQANFRELVENEQVVDYDVEIEQKLATRAVFEEQLTDVRTQILSRAAKIRRINEFMRENTDVLIPIPEIAQVRIIEDLNYRMANLRLELEALLEKYTERERRVQNVMAQIEAVEAQIREEVRNFINQETTELRRFEAEEEALVEAIAEIDQELVSLQSVQAPFQNLVQEIEDKQGIISQLSRQYTDSLHAGETDTRLSRARQISPAVVPQKPVFPDLRMNLLIGIPIAILIGLAVIIFLDYFDRTFPTPEKVERVTGLPVLATINYIDPKKQPVFR